MLHSPLFSTGKIKMLEKKKRLSNLIVIQYFQIFSYYRLEEVLPFFRLCTELKMVVCRTLWGHLALTKE